jgi:chromosome segregation ATPase
MIKKLIFWSVIIGGVLFVVNSVRPGSIHTAWKRAQAKFERNITPEFELARIRDQIAQLTPDMHRNIARVAEEMVKVESLERQVNELQAKLQTNKDELALMTEAIEKGATRVSIGSQEYRVTKVKDKLRTCKNQENELNRLQKILEAKKAGVESLRQQLAEMKQQKQELEVMAAQYDAQLKELALQQTRSKMKLDDSRLAEIKAAFEQLREKIDVERKTADLADQFNLGTLNEKKVESNKDVVDEAREYLGAPKEKAEAAKK